MTRGGCMEALDANEAKQSQSPPFSCLRPYLLPCSRPWQQPRLENEFGLHSVNCPAVKFLAAMGWFGGSKPGLTDSTPPARQDRQKCWDSRDAYYKCLDDCGVLVPGEEGKKCLAELASYQKSCAKSWVSSLSYALDLFGPFTL